MIETMPTKSSIVIDNKTIPVDCQLLFQRLIIIAKQSPEEFKHTFTVQVITLLASLSSKDGLMNEAKPQLSDALWKMNGDNVSDNWGFFTPFIRPSLLNKNARRVISSNVNSSGDCLAITMSL